MPLMPNNMSDEKTILCDAESLRDTLRRLIACKHQNINLHKALFALAYRIDLATDVKRYRGDFSRFKKDDKASGCKQLLEIEKYERDRVALIRELPVNRGLLDNNYNDVEQTIDRENEIQAKQHYLIKIDLGFLLRLKTFEDEFTDIINNINNKQNSEIFASLYSQVSVLKSLLATTYEKIEKKYIQDVASSSSKYFSCFEKSYVLFKSKYDLLNDTFSKATILEQKTFANFSYPATYNNFLTEPQNEIQKVIHLFQDYSKKGLLYFHIRKHQKLANQIVEYLTKLLVTSQENKIVIAHDYLSSLKNVFITTMSTTFDSKKPSSFLKRIHYALDFLLVEKPAENEQLANSKIMMEI